MGAEESRQPDPAKVLLADIAFSLLAAPLLPLEVMRQVVYLVNSCVLPFLLAGACVTTLSGRRALGALAGMATLYALVLPVELTDLAFDPFYHLMALAWASASFLAASKPESRLRLLGLLLVVGVWVATVCGIPLHGGAD